VTTESAEAIALKHAFQQLTAGAPAPPSGSTIRRRVARRRALTTVAVASVGVLAGAGIATGISDRSSLEPDIVQPIEPGPDTPSLPAGARPLPGGVAADRLGVLRVLHPSAVRVPENEALEVYDRMSGAASRKDRVVRTAVARIAYVNDGRVQTSNLWVISVWMHPPDIGVAPQRNWCVDYGFVNATTGHGGGHVYQCLPLGQEPTSIH
jgi:hypothetical protein